MELMIPVFLDFETAYSTEYSLTRMTTAEYVFDPRFELLCVALQVGFDGPVQCAWGHEAALLCQSIDWSDKMLVSHNVRFDGAVLAWRLGLHPAFFMCTMAMSQVMAAPFCGSAALKNVCVYIKAPPKGDEIINARGKWLKDFTPVEAQRYLAYCANDMLRSIDIWHKFGPKFPAKEARIVDDMARMFIYPKIQLDHHRLLAHLAQEKANKDELLAAAGAFDKSAIMSDAKLADALISLGVDPPRKVSPTTGQEAWAFAKSDEGFTDLLEDADPAVVALVTARLGLKSTIEETRTQRLIDVAMATQPTAWLPVPLRYGAAITHRAGGTDFINVQNLRRGGELRRCLVAPPGHKIVTVDASQIELRLLMWLAGQHDMLALFERGANPYVDFGLTFFQRMISKERNLEDYTLAKICVLSCGYSVSGPKFRRTARSQSNGKVLLDEAQAAAAVATYRAKYNAVPRLWKFAAHMVAAMAVGAQTLSLTVDNYPVFRTGIHALWGPEGELPMVYPRLHSRSSMTAEEEYSYDYGKRTNKRLFGAKLVENMCQYLGRLIVYGAHLRIKDRTGYTPAMQVHDELVYVAPDHHVAWLEPILVEEMSRRPSWAPRLPLGAEAHHGINYAEAK